MDKKALAEALAGMNADELESIAPHIAHDLKTQAVEAFKEEHPAAGSTTESKTNKPDPKDGKEKEEETSKLAELEKKVASYEKKEKEDKVKELIDAEVKKFLPKFQGVARSLIESTVKIAGECDNPEKVVKEAVEAAEKTFEESKLGEVKGAPASTATENGKDSGHPFGFAGYGNQ